MKTKRRSDAIVEVTQETRPASERPREKTSKFGQCQVCGDQARIINYGALSCQSCKTFFRRNGFHCKSVRPCLVNQECEVTLQTRRNCSACRLAKCLAVGMCPELIRKEDCRRGQSLSSSIPPPRQQRKYRSSAQSQDNTMDQPTDQSNLKQGFLLDVEHDFISNISGKFYSLIKMPELQYMLDHWLHSLVSRTDASFDAWAIFHGIQQGIDSFLSSLADFNCLDLHERKILFTRNLSGMMSLLALLLLNQAAFVSYAMCLDTSQESNYSNLIFALIPFNHRINLDSTGIMLCMVVLAFSSNCSIITMDALSKQDYFERETVNYFSIQNSYLELLWKYLIEQYGYTDSVRRFSQWIQLILHMFQRVFPFQAQDMICQEVDVNPANNATISNNFEKSEQSA